MHIAASNPLSIDKNNLDKNVLDKELEIIKAELINSGKKPEMIDKISQGKLNKFVSENTLLNQVWIMDPNKKVSDIEVQVCPQIPFPFFFSGDHNGKDVLAKSREKLFKLGFMFIKLLIRKSEIFFD